MSTFSTDLKIELIGTGEQSGTWGTTTNENFANVFEQALVGRVTVAFTDADVTLTATDTVSSQSFRRLYLNCTGANTLTRNLIVPTINKTYVVQNNTTGGQDIVVKTSAGTGVTIPNGRSAAVYANGTDVVQAFDYFPTVYTGTLDLTNLEVTNIKAKDGTAAMSIADSTGIVTVSSQLNVDNVNINGNTISSTDSNGNLVLAPNGTGDVQLDADTVRVGDSNAAATLTTNGTGNLTISTNSGTNSGTIVVNQGINGDIAISPNGTGTVVINTDLDVDNLNLNGNTISTTNTDGNMTFTANGTGYYIYSGTQAVLIPKGNNTTQRPGTPVTGMLRYNTTSDEFEGYSGASASWKSVGGAAISNDTSTASDLYPTFVSATTGTASTLNTSNAKLLYKPSTGELKASAPVASNGILVNANTVAADYTIASGFNGLSAGPVTVNSGITVTISSGSNWTVV